MRKLFFFIAAVVFIGCVFFGFKAASKLFSQRAENQNNNIEIPQAHLIQSNYLLGLVNDLSADKPQLISVWGVLNYPSSPPQVVFLPLYPTANTETNREISSAFDLSNTKKIPGRSIGKLGEAVDLEFDGYFVTDNTALMRFAAYANLETLELFSKPAESTEISLAVQNSINSFFTALCQLCMTGASNSFFSKIEWSQLLPDHFSTDLSFEELMLMIDRINNSTALTTCEVLASQ
jgi:hypothetical protein